MSIETGGPAFPQHVAPSYRQEPEIWGMSLRDYFAGQALAGWMAQPDERTFPMDCKLSLEEWRASVFRDDAETLYRYADAMLEARKAVKP
jgi:hypothetical protein